MRTAHPLPTVKTDLKTLDARQDTVVWLGHSSCFVVFAGRRILIDPVLSAYASPVPFSTRAFDGTNLYSIDDLPRIDVLLITHDHWDHLDHATVSALRGQVGRAIVPLGVGAHLEHRGYARIDAASQGRPYRLLTPMIGEPLRVGDSGQHFAHWWQDDGRLASSDYGGKP